MFSKTLASLRHPSWSIPMAHLHANQLRPLPRDVATSITEADLWIEKLEARAARDEQRREAKRRAKQQLGIRKFSWQD